MIISTSQIPCSTVFFTIINTTLNIMDHIRYPEVIINLWSLEGINWNIQTISVGCAERGAELLIVAVQIIIGINYHIA